MLFPKGPTAKAARKQKRAGVATTEKKHKAEARLRDGNACRLPHRHSGRIEVAHLRDKKMGGDKDGSRSLLKDLLCTCHSGHQGKRSLHSKHLLVIPQDVDRGTNGPVTVYERDSHGAGFGPWRVMGVEVEIGVWV